MKQILLRVDDDLHRRLTEQAQHAGTSVNSLASAMLDLGVNPIGASRRERLLVRLVAIGQVGRSRGGNPAQPRRVDREAVLASMRGTGAIADQLIRDERR